MKTIQFLSLAALALLLSSACAMAQTGTGQRFGTRDARTCAARNTASPTPAQLKEYFICGAEVMVPSSSFGDSLNLVGNINLQFSKARKFMMATDAWPGIDVTQPVFDVRGSFTHWTCFLPGNPNAPNVPHTGKNCFRAEGQGMKGECFRDTFGDWSCKVCCTPTTTQYAAPPAAGESRLLQPAFGPPQPHQPSLASAWPAPSSPTTYGLRLGTNIDELDSPMLLRLVDKV